MLAMRSHDHPVLDARPRHIHVSTRAKAVILWSCLLAVPAFLSAEPASAQKQQPLPPPVSAPIAPPAGPVGVWIDDTGRGAVEIKPCGANLCGMIYWLQEPVSEKTGRPVTDANNPDAAKRNRAVCGLQVIGSAKPQSDGTWDEGWIYDPKVGKSYDVAFELEKKDRLSVTGYKGVKFLSKTFVWTRAPANLVRCDVSAAEKPMVPGATTATPAVNGAAQKPLPPSRATTTPLPSPTQR